MRIAVDQHRAGAASALAATEFGSHVAQQLAQDGQQIDAAVDKDGGVASVVTKLQRGLGHEISLALSLLLAREQVAQMDADNLSPIPGAGECIVDRRSSFRYGGDRGGDARCIERAPFESVL